MSGDSVAEQFPDPKAETREPLSLEAQATVFFSLVVSAIFFWFGVIYYYDTFLTDSTGGEIALYPFSNYSLVIGTLTLGALFLLVALACWRRPRSSRSYLGALGLSGVMTIAFFLFRYSTATVYSLPQPTIYYDFLQGDSTFTGLVLLLLVFFAFRSYRMVRSSREKPAEPAMPGMAQEQAPQV